MATSETLKEGILNIDDLFLGHAKQLYEKLEKKDLEKNLGCKLPWEDLCKEIDTSELLIYTTKPNYANSQDHHQQEQQELQLESEEVVVVRQPQHLCPATSNSCIFETQYTNACDRELVNTINTTRTTRASCTFRINRGYKLNREFGMKLALPKEILEFNAGFSTEFSVEKEAEKTDETEISWSINTEVRVPGCKDPDKPTMVSAKVMIEEREFKANFTAVVFISGNVKVRLFNSEARQLAVICCTRLTKVLTPQLGFVPVGDPNCNKVKYVITGGCHARFGVSQRVDIRPIISD